MRYECVAGKLFDIERQIGVASVRLNRARRRGEVYGTGGACNPRRAIGGNRNACHSVIPDASQVGGIDEGGAVARKFGHESVTSVEEEVLRIGPPEGTNRRSCGRWIVAGQSEAADKNILRRIERDCHPSVVATATQIRRKDNLGSRGIQLGDESIACVKPRQSVTRRSPCLPANAAQLCR